MMVAWRRLVALDARLTGSGGPDVGRPPGAAGVALSPPVSHWKGRTLLPYGSRTPSRAPFIFTEFKNDCSSLTFTLTMFI